MVKNSVILGNYSVITEIKKDPIFTWVKATELPNAKSVLLQILHAELSSGLLKDVFDFFDTFSALGNKTKFFLPEYILSDQDIRMGVVYRHAAFQPLPEAIRKTPQKALDWWNEVIEQLHYLHQRDLVHGYVSPENFVIINESIFLINFGYAPLLRSGSRIALQTVGEYCAPEVKTTYLLTPQADIYSFAKTVGYCHPQIKETEWYQKLTEGNLENRPRKIRDVSPQLSQIVNKKTSDIISKYRLTADTEPKQGGAVNGAGNFPEGKAVLITAIPNEGYVFDHWNGDIISKENPFHLTIERDQHIIAVFAKDMTAYYALTAICEPLEGGTIVGDGTYLRSTMARITANAFEEYAFERWEGDENGQENPKEILIDREKHIKAIFRKKKYHLRIQAVPIEGGNVFGEGDYTPNQVIKISAFPAMKYFFEYWSGDATGKANPQIITMDAEKNITAHFSRNYTIEINAIPLEGGTISGGGSYTKMQSSLIKAFPAEGYEFDHWDGDIVSNKNPIAIEIDNDKKITAVFLKKERKNALGSRIFSLEIRLEPTYTGKISVNNEYITTIKTFPEGSIIDLKAEPSNLWEWAFEKWSGDIIGTANPISLEMNSNKMIIAHFKTTIWVNEFELKIKVEPKEGGKVIENEEYLKGNVVKIEAIPNSGWKFAYWSGDMEGYSQKVRIIMDSPKKVIAHFIKNDSEEKDVVSILPLWAR